LSWIQSHILIELTRHATRRYSQLRPGDVEGNLFMYHLKGLLRDGLVEKTEREYRLTAKGLQFAGTLSLKTGKTRQQPKILTAIICKNDKNEYLLSRWHRQPNIGQVSFPHGMAHYGETISDMAALELAEKAGLKGEVTYRGDVYVRGMRDGVLDRHMLVHLFEAQSIQGGREGEMRPEVSEPFWAALSTLNPSDFVPGFYEIATLVEKQLEGVIFSEITVAIPSA
jgi:ADP-ribose pyrophosphatase YjhB (NUDIX family)